MEDLAAIVGDRLHAARQERGLSMASLAAAAGIGKGSLSEIEHGARNPTLGTLYSLADALGLPLAALLDGRVGARIASPGIEARLLDVSTDQGWTVEVYRLSLAPGTERVSGGHGDGVVEHLVVTAGSLRVGRLGEERDLGPGESAAWGSDVAHTYMTLGEEPAESVLVIRSPTPSNGPNGPAEPTESRI